MISLIFMSGFLCRSSYISPCAIFRYPDDLRNIVQQCATPKGKHILRFITWWQNFLCKCMHQTGNRVKGGLDWITRRFLTELWLKSSFWTSHSAPQLHKCRGTLLHLLCVYLLIFFLLLQFSSINKLLWFWSILGQLMFDSFIPACCRKCENRFIKIESEANKSLLIKCFQTHHYEIWLSWPYFICI